MRIILYISILGFLGLPTAALADKKINGRVTPMPPKVKTDPLARMYAASEVPDPLENYAFTVNGEVEGTVFFTSAVPLYYITDYRSSAGTIPIGTDFKAEFIRAVGGRHFYGFTEPQSKEKDPFKPKSIKWIDGRFLKITKK